MRELWHSMTPLPGDLRLYGGGALALYLNHRASTDFDFVTPRPVVGYALIESIPWLRGAALSGGEGMIDGRYSIGDRDIKLTFMESGRMVPNPQTPPIPAPNGVLVATPEDLVISKAAACISRGAPRDYIDIAAAAMAWPGMTEKALRKVPNQSPLAVARMLAGADSVTGVSKRERECLGDLATRLAGYHQPNGRGR